MDQVWEEWRSEYVRTTSSKDEKYNSKKDMNKGLETKIIPIFSQHE